METSLKSLPPPYEEASSEAAGKALKPIVLVLTGDAVISATSPTTAPLYKMSWNVTSIPQKSSSVVFERVEQSQSQNPDGPNPSKSPTCHLFYLAHPPGARFQTDTPEYYITSVSSEALGNISLETSNKRSRFQKAEFRALLSAKKTASSIPLFDDEEKAQLLFTIKPKWIGGRYTYTDSSCEQVAYEDEDRKAKEHRHRLVITAPMDRATRDALVATWCLRLWYETAESREARSEGKLS